MSIRLSNSRNPAREMMPNPVSPDDSGRKTICRSRIPAEQTTFLPRGTILGGLLIRSTLYYSDVPRTSHYFSCEPSRVFDSTVISPITLFQRLD
ncbi:hypothetical protein CDAR_49651 [Caerostris darwini]|uniref:Uncharacterized protein n=1 Tax=Caerostris darwini TaxID=1538125 RepID=A0AAV4T1N9_9ARAC|nr:hypothetical protein CDAR_49651 [Caerostris darwini]